MFSGTVAQAFTGCAKAKSAATGLTSCHWTQASAAIMRSLFASSIVWQQDMCPKRTIEGLDGQAHVAFHFIAVASAAIRWTAI